MKSKQIQKFQETEIGQIPEDWELCELQKISDVIDSAHKTPKYSIHGFPMVRVTDIKSGFLNLNNTFKVSKEVYDEFTKNHKPQKNDIVLSRVGTYGISSFVNSDELFCLGQNTVVIHSQFSRFIYYALNSPPVKNQIEEKVVGSTQKTISLSNIRGLLIPKPTNIQELNRIEKILFDLDSKISNFQIQNNILENMIQTIFKSWFIDFDDQTKFVNSELGEIPQGWKTDVMTEIIEINPSRKLTKGKLSPYLSMANIPTFALSISDYVYRPYTSGTKFRNGDTLLARITPSLENGKTAFVDFLDDGEVGWGSTEFIVLKPKAPFPSEYGYCLARTDEVRSHAIMNMTGTSGRQRVPNDCFNNFKVVIPPTIVLQKFSNIVKPIFIKIKKNHLNIKSTSNLRNSLLPKLMLGEIRVV